MGRMEYKAQLCRFYYLQNFRQRNAATNLWQVSTRDNDFEDNLKLIENVKKGIEEKTL